MIEHRVRRFLFPGILLVLVVAVILILQRSPRFEPSWPDSEEIGDVIPTPLQDPLQNLPHIEVYFNGSCASVYRDPYRNIWRYGDNLEQVITAVIDSASRSIDMAVQELNLPLIAEALREKHAEGVQVRIVLENKYSHVPSNLSPGQVESLTPHERAKYDEFFRLADLDGDGLISPAESAQRDAMYLLHGAAVPLIDDTADGSKGSGTMHHKFMVVDERWVICGSANFTMSGVHGDFANPMTRGNANHLILIESRELATIFIHEFNTLWGDGPGGKTDSKFGKQKPHRLPQHATVDGCRITVQLSPAPKGVSFESTTNGLIARAVGDATRSVDMALFVFSSQEIVDALSRTAAKHPDLRLRGIFDAGFATRYYSETLDMWQMALKDKGRYEVSSETGAANRPWTTQRGLIGIAVLPEGDKMHHKFAVIDSEIVVTGSQNWSPTANSLNDEALVIIESRMVAAHFLREIQRLSRSLHVGPTRRLLERVKERGGAFPPNRGTAEARSPGAIPTQAPDR